MAADTTPTTKTIKARTVSVDTYWVCDTKGALPGDDFHFNCIEAMQSFPGEPENGYEPTRLLAFTTNWRRLQDKRTLGRT